MRRVPDLALIYTAQNAIKNRLLFNRGRAIGGSALKKMLALDLNHPKTSK